MSEVQLMGVRQAAKVLGLNASTVSRHLAKYPRLVHDGKVDPEELRRHREDTVNAAKSGNHAGLSFGEADLGDGDEDECESHSQVDGLPAAPTSPAAAKLAEERAGFESIRRRREEVKFANELGLLADVADIEDAGREIGGLLQRSAEAVLNADLVGRIRRAPDDRRALAEVEAAKDDFFKRLGDEAEQSLRRLAGGDDEEVAHLNAEE